MTTHQPTASREGSPPSLRSTRVSALPPREREILVLVEAGHTSAEIAEQLGLSPRSVDSALERTRQRLGAKTRLHAALLIQLVPEERDDDADGSAFAADVADHIDDALRALIVRLSEGATVTTAARAAGMSRRSASRRLAELRDRLGAGSTSQTVALACRHLVPGGYPAAS
ncbi:MAG: helix-turn-helix transcriptional regulator [Acidimicrobiales bacterium]|nr:helix-turn-helix transcriptional regulator [Acidimicrobiales bacterium]